MSKVIVDLENQRFGNLVVLKEAGRTNDKKVTWLCLCDCGATKVISGRSLRVGLTKSCGCIHKKQLIERSTVHGKSRTRENYVWSSMKQRCLNSRNKAYKNYGGRGISVCDRWLSSFEDFINDMGPKPFEGAQIDRINNDGNYEPTNCRWVTKQENHMNRRCTIK